MIKLIKIDIKDCIHKIILKKVYHGFNKYTEKHNCFQH